MKIICDNCGTKYSASDEKVRGKTFKIRCKKCDSVIVVRGMADSAEAPESAEEPVAPGDPATAAVWHVVLQGEQQGPYTAAQVAEFVGDGQLNNRSYCWRPGLDDWRRLEDIEVLFKAVTEAASPSSARPTAQSEQEQPAEEAQAAAPASRLGLNDVPDADDEEEDAALAGLGGDETAVEDVFGGFTAPEQRGAMPENASEALAQALGGQEEPAPAPSPAKEEAARGGGRDDGSDLFAHADEGGMFPAEEHGEEGAGLFGEPAPAPAKPSVSTAGMTGTRNENSVLFSLSNLQAIAAPKEGGDAPAPGRRLLGDSSGLIDIRTMASDIEPSGPAPVIDDIISIGGGLGSEIGGQVLVPIQQKAETNKMVYAVIAVGIAVLIGLVVLIIIVASGGTERPTTIVQQPQILAPQPPVQQPVEAPQQPEPTKVQPAGSGPAPVPISEDEPTPEEPGGTKTSSPHSGTKRPEGTPTTDQGEQTPGPTDPTKASPNPEQVKRSSTALSNLLDGVVSDTSGPSKAAPTGDQGGGSSTLSRAQVQAGMNAVAAEVRRCGAGQAGTVMVSVVIDGASGRVTSANVTGDFTGTPVGSCAARAVRRATFPSFGQPSLTVRYPFQVQ